MKQIILSLSLLLLLSACKKEEPTLAELSVGTYTLSTVKLNSAKVPGMTGRIVITEISEEVVDASITLTIQGKSETVDASGLDLIESGTDIDIYQGNGLVGTVSGKTILFYLDDDPDVWEMSGSRK